jgi:hypothetical protein
MYLHFTSQAGDNKDKSDRNRRSPSRAEQSSAATHRDTFCPIPCLPTTDDKTRIRGAQTSARSERRRGTGAERSRARCSLWNSGTKRPKREEPGEARRARRNERTYRRPRRCPRPRASAPPMRTEGGGGPRRAPELAASLRSRRHSTRRGLGHEH